MKFMWIWIINLVYCHA